PQRLWPGADRQVRGNFSYVASVLKVLAHELLDRQQARNRRIISQSRQPKLIGSIEHVFCLSVLKVQVVANPEQKIPRLAKLALLLLRQVAPLGQPIDVALAIADEPDPANKLQIAQAPARAF